MSDHPTQEACAATCAPYRSSPAAPAVSGVAPSIGPLLVLVFSALSMAVSMASLTLLHRLRQAPRTSVRAVGVTLGGAALDLARRHRRSLYVAPDVSARARSLAIADGAIEGEFEPSLRALSAHAAAHGMWLHEVDEVLRLERVVLSATLRCDDDLEVCARRLGRVATLDVRYDARASRRIVHLRAHPGVSATSALRGAVEAAGLTVDGAGRSVYVNAPAARGADSGARAISLSRDELDELMGGSSALRPVVRIAPVVRRGRTVGVRVFGVREGSLASRLGIESGDVLTRVNGFDIASPERCLEAYGSLRRSEIVTLEVLRGERPITLTWALRGHRVRPS